MSYGLGSLCFFFFSSRRRHTRYIGDWSSDVCSSDLSIRKGYEARTRRDSQTRRHPGRAFREAQGSQPWPPTRFGVASWWTAQIGRASCRERVEVGVGAGTGQEKEGGERSDRRQREGS